MDFYCVYFNEFIESIFRMYGFIYVDCSSLHQEKKKNKIIIGYFLKIKLGNFLGGQKRSSKWIKKGATFYFFSKKNCLK